MRRRDFLAAGLGASSLTITGRAWSSPTADQRFLVLFLRGGYDAISAVIPTYSDLYYETRRNIAIARPDAKNANSALDLDGDWSLHPALKDSIYPLWQRKQVAFIPFVGSDDLTRSHFETQDTIELGQPVAGSRNYRSGFLARLSAQLFDARSIAFTVQPPLIFHGDRVVPNIAVASIGKPGVSDRQAKLIQNMYRGRDLQASVDQGFSVRDKAYSSIAGEMVAANRGAIAPSGFELAARRVARMMQAEYNIAFLDVGGWDTHVNQGAATGVLANRLGQLGRGLAGLAEEMGPQGWAKTTVVVVSEFGRTFRENGDKGTDHGHGSIYWVLGGAVRGGRLAGPQIKLAANTLNENRDLPVLTDYRALIGGVASRLYGLTGSQVGTIFPGIAPVDLALL